MMNERRTTGGGGSVAARMCSITDTGLVFQTSSSLEVGSEVRLSIQANLMGRESEWAVQGWVVECHPAKMAESQGFEVTLLFSDLPQGLKRLLAHVKGRRFYAYPPVRGAEIFGLN